MEQITFRRYISVQNFNFDIYLVWAWNLLFYLKGKHRLRVCGKTVWRRLFVPWREAAIGSCSNLNNEEFHIFYPLPNMIRVINSKRMSWAGCVSCTEELRNVCNSFIGKPRPRWEDSIKWFLRKYFVRDWTIWFKIWASDSHFCTLHLTYGYLWNRISDPTEQRLVS